MRFGMVDRMGPDMWQFGIGPRERVILGADVRANVGCPIATNGEFAAYLYASA